VRRHASFDPDQAPRHIGEPGCDPAAGNLLPQNDCSLIVEADQMQGVLARIDANVCATVAAALWDMAMCSSCIQAPRSFSERFGAGARPVHPILGPRNFLGEVGPDRGSLLGLMLTCIKNGFARHVNQQNGACEEISKW
jgi:hypothetical protein